MGLVDSRSMSPTPTSFHEVGDVSDKINVEISFHIIRLFSEGLYSSPNKAIEELVSNAFDADARHVHVVVPADRGASGASIAVIDDGTGMDDEGLKNHWIVGESQKEANRTTDLGRKSIGKFGIGKLAAYALGDRLTHITKANGHYFSTTIDFRSVPRTTGRDGGEGAGPVTLDLRTLAEADARAALSSWLPDGDGRRDLKLFGNGAADSWTVAVISDLKDLAIELRQGRLRWVLSTAMPLRDDFALYLNDEPVAPSKIDAAKVGTWVLGRDITEVPRPGPTELAAETDPDVTEPDYRHWNLVDGQLGPISGYVEAFKEPINAGKSTGLSRSNGFFVYVHGRLINPDDAGFGIDRNLLRHGTFTRLRVVVNIDRLDEELRSSRESLRDGPRLDGARSLLQGLFNFARTKIEKDDEAEEGERRASKRLSDGPASLTARPILRMMVGAFDGSFVPRHLAPIDPDAFVDVDELRTQLEARLEAGEDLVTEIVYADLGTDRPIAVLDGVSGTLSINNEHPFVAHFSDEFGDKRKNLPLELFATSEILLEGSLYSSDVRGAQLAAVLDARDELLRHLARSSGPENSLTVAQRIIESESSKTELEEAVVAAFSQLGYEAVPIGGNGKPDGLAEANLSKDDDGVGPYRVSLEAKSKESPGGKVKKSAVQVSTIARHRKDHRCDHAIVVGPEFETGADDGGAVMQEIEQDRKNNPGKTITLIRTRDLAQLVRLSPVKRLSLRDLRGLYECSSPTESAKWVQELSEKEVETAPYQAILVAVGELQKADVDQQVDYGSLKNELRHKGLSISKDDLKEACRALSHMAPGLFTTSEDRVELDTHPDKVLARVHDYIEKAPDESS